MTRKFVFDTQSLEIANQLGSANKWEQAYEALLAANPSYEKALFAEFRDKECDVSDDEIGQLDAVGCSTLLVAISRQIRWDEPPLFSINGNLVDLESVEFKYERQIKALIARLKNLDP
jgi:hypothetical protein